MARDVADADQGAPEAPSGAAEDAAAQSSFHSLADGPERLVEDLEAVERRLLVDVERRVDADDRRVRHRDEAAAQALLEERLREVLRDELLRAPVLHELDAEEQPLAAHVADDRGASPASPGARASIARADALGVLDQVLLDDDLERREARRRGERIAAVGGGAARRVRPGLRLRELVGRDDRRRAGSRRRCPCRPVMTSGTTPSWSTPHILPVRPKPVIISSAMKSAPCSFAIARIGGKEARRRDDVARPCPASARR